MATLKNLILTGILGAGLTGVFGENAYSQKSNVSFNDDSIEIKKVNIYELRDWFTKTTWEWTYKYNCQGKLIEKIYKRDDMSDRKFEKVKQINYTYDNQGRLIGKIKQKAQ